MIIRIVRMQFRPEALTEFEVLFQRTRDKIRAYPGCLHLQLLGDASWPQVRYTLSHWESEAHLEDYRHSELFRTTWAATKVLFEAQPLAYSLITLPEHHLTQTTANERA